jgi:hypothetical protein
MLLCVRGGTLLVSRKAVKLSDYTLKLDEQLGTIPLYVSLPTMLIWIIIAHIKEMLSR